VSSLILASQIAYDALGISGAGVLIVLGLRSLLRRDRATAPAAAPAAVPPRSAGWRSGLVTSASNPKLAVFFVALFPQFVEPDAPVLAYALAMAGVIVALDIAWFSILALAVDRTRQILRPKVQAGLERFTGAVMVGLGVRLATESR
jgi:threonine/homoserine/homoserine lactone efflux protein